MGILEGLANGEIVFHHQFEFVDTTSFPNGIEKDFVEFDHLSFTHGYLCF